MAPAFAARGKVMGNKTIQRKETEAHGKEEPNRNGDKESLTADATF